MEGALTRVHPAVLSETGSLGEGSPALLTAEGPLA